MKTKTLGFRPKTKMEPSDVIFNMQFAYTQNDGIIGHLKKGTTGYFKKENIFFLRVPRETMFSRDNRDNRGDGEGMQVVPYISKLEGKF